MATGPDDHDEQALVRRVMTVLVALALLTVPLLHVALDSRESWVSVTHLGVLAVAFAALGRTRFGTTGVVMALAVVLWGVTLIGVGTTALHTVTGVSDGAGLGTGALWLAAGIAPAVFLVLPMRRALLSGIVAIGGILLMLAVVTSGAVMQVATHPGVWQVVVSVVVVLGSTAVVAWLAGRSADERRAALLVRQQRAADAARLEASQRRRQTLFSRTATELQAPMAELAAAIGPLQGAGDDSPVAAADRSTLARVEAVAGDLLDQVVNHIDGLVALIQGDAAAADVDRDVRADGEVASDERESDPVATVLMTFGVLAMVALDAWRVVLLGSDGVPDAHALAASANRMLVVLFLAAAVLAVRFPGRFGWWLTGLAALAHPVAVLTLLDAAAREAVLLPFASAWRIAVLSAGMLALLAMVIERRVRDRDALVAAASTDELRSAELRRGEEAAGLAYAEAVHELKNPLAVVQGSARTLSTHGAVLSDDQTVRLRTALTRGVDRLQARLDVMRAVAADARDEARGTGATRRPAAAADVLLDALAAARPELGDQAVDVDVRVTGDWTSAAPDQVVHVLENLFSNAHKYGDPDGIVSMVAYRDGADIVVEVANRGGDLTPAETARIFEPYWRAGNAGRAAGTGLGLAIVERLVEGWGGRCWVRVDGGWTRIGFTMPVTGSLGTPVWQELQDQLE